MQLPHAESMVQWHDASQHQHAHRRRQELGLLQAVAQHEDRQTDHTQVPDRLDQLQESTQRMEERPKQVCQNASTAVLQG